MQKRWNISILVIFVLLASSLLGILSMNFVQQMMQQSAVVNSYYKTYYLSKAWIELGLAQIKHRGIGFDYMVNTGDQIVLDNFLCGPNCSLSANISGTASLLSKKFWQGSGCSSPYILSGGGSIVLPLFRDATPWIIGELFETGIVYENLANLFHEDDKISFISDFGWDVTFGIMILSGEDLSQNGIFFKKWSLKWLSTFRDDFEAYLATIDATMYYSESRLKDTYWLPWLIQNWFKIYLMISNASETPESFCISAGQNVLPTDTFFIQSQASYGNQKVALDASYAQPIPGFLFNAYSSYK